MLMQTRQMQYLFPLDTIAANEEVRIITIYGKKEFIHRLATMGLMAEVEIEVLQQGVMGVVILCNETRWALDVETAQKIFVVPTMLHCHYCC